MAWIPQVPSPLVLVLLLVLVVLVLVLVHFEDSSRMSNSNADGPVGDDSHGPVGEPDKAPELSGHEKVADILRNQGVQKEAVDIILENRIDSNDLEAFDEEDLVDLNMTKAHAKRVIKLKPKICGTKNLADLPESRPR